MKRLFTLILLALLVFSCDKDEPIVEDAEGSIFAIVRFNGQPVDGAQVSTEPSSSTATTDLTGSAILTDVPIGGYKVNASHPSIGTGSSSVTVKTNEATDVFINLIGGAFESPSVSITAPFDGSSHNQGMAIPFAASVSDSKDAPNTLSLQWESSLDGIFNTNPADNNGKIELNINDLSEGQHLITLTAMDSDMLEASDEINIIVKKLPDAVVLDSIELGANGLFLNWTTSVEAEFSNYKVLRAEAINGLFEVIEVLSDINSTQFEDTQVSFGTRYYYRIAVVVNNGDESLSNTESQLFEGENIDLGVNIVRMIIDPVRPYIYALDQINNSLLFINKESKTVDKTIFVGSSPSDLDLNLDNSKIYIANFGSTQIAVVDPETQEKIDDIFVDTQAGTWDGNPYRLACLGSDRLVFTSEDQHNNLKVVNANTGALISVTGSVYQPGLITTSDQDILLATESGTTGSQAIRFNFDGTDLDEVDASDSRSNFSGIRDGCISGDNKYLFYNESKLLINNLQSKLGTFSEWIVDCNNDGSIAIGIENVWNAETFSIVKPLPVSSSIIRLDVDDNTIYIYDNNTSKIYITTIN